MLPLPPPPPRAAPSWFLIPSLFYLPETSLGVAVAGGVHGTISGAARPSSLHAAVLGTVRAQASVDVTSHLVLAAPVILDGNARVSRYPDRFFGIGPETPASAAEDFTARYVEVLLAPRFVSRGERLGFGPRFHFRAEAAPQVQPGGALAAGTIPGSHGYVATGLGLGALWDDRNDLYEPSHGRYAEAWYIEYPGDVGRGHGEFGRGALDYRQFFALPPGEVLAVNAYLEGARGSTPFELLPKLGGDRFLRGFRAGRYRANLMYVLQAEYRFPLVWRFGGAAFAGIGGVASSIAGVFHAPIRPAGGGGLRFRLTEDRVQIRLDVAWGESAVPAFYVIVFEAF